MSSILIFNRVNSSKSTRIKFEDIAIGNTVIKLKEKVATTLEKQLSDIDLLYGGQILKDNEVLSTYNIKPGVTIHAMTRQQNVTNEQSEIMDAAAVQQVVTALQSALINPAYRNTVEKMLSNPETLENLITATPGLEKDPIAVAMLQDPELLAMLADPKLIHKVIKSHPSLGHAASFVAAAVSEEAAKGGYTATGRTSVRGQYYSMDQMSDDEDMDTGGRPLFAGSNQPITANQLGAALAALTGSMGMSSSPAGAGGSSTGGANALGGDDSGNITNDFFRQAMAAAGTNPGTSSQQPRPITEADLQQLREMGITDDTVARRALEASGGDVQAALELIFGDGL